MSKHYKHEKKPLRIEQLHVRLTDETIQASRALANALLPTFRRMLADGWVMENGRLIK